MFEKSPGLKVTGMPSLLRGSFGNLEFGALWLSGRARIGCDVAVGHGR